MYETRLVGSGGKASGLAGLGGASRGPLDVLLNGAVGLLLLYLIFTLVEPFWTSAIEKSQQVQMDSNFQELSKALSRYRLKHGPYDTKDLRALKPLLSKVPADPWGNPYQVDPLFRRIFTLGPDGVLGDSPDSEAGFDDQIHFYRPAWRLMVVRTEDGQPVPTEVRFDGWDVRPVAGQYRAGTTLVHFDDVLGKEISVAVGPGGNEDIAIRELAAEELPQWLVEGPGRDFEPAISRVDGAIYFASIRSDPSPLLFRTALSGGAAVPVTEKPDSFEVPHWKGDYAPSIGRKSGHLAFHSQRHPDDAKARICFIPKGKPLDRVRMLKSPAGKFPVWSSDGKQVLFLSDDGRFIERVPFPPRGKIKSDRIALRGAASGFAVSPDEEFLAVLFPDGAGTSLDILRIEDGNGRTILKDEEAIRSISWYPSAE